MNETTPPVTDCEIVDPNSMQSLYDEVIAETATNDREEVKKLIAERVAEIRRLETLTAIAKKELAKLLQKDVGEVALMATTRGGRNFVGGTPIPMNQMIGKRFS